MVLSEKIQLWGRLARFEDLDSRDGDAVPEDHDPSKQVDEQSDGDSASDDHDTSEHADKSTTEKAGVESSTELQAFIKLVVDSPAYPWLLANIRASLLLSPPDESVDCMGEIQATIMNLFSAPLVARKSVPAQTHKILVGVDWDLSPLLKETAFTHPLADVIHAALTITGSSEDAQCLPCAFYLSQTWPGSGPYFLLALKHAIQGRADGARKAKPVVLPDSTTVKAIIVENQKESSCSLQLEVCGIPESLVEIVQQAAWVGAAFFGTTKTKPTLCRPILTVGEPGNPNITNLQVSFVSRELDTGQENCHCWHELLRSPIIAEGFPIPKRSVSGTGLEIPLHIMSSLVGTTRVNTFGGKVFIKGFSRMLVPTKQTGDLLVWHLRGNPRDQRISYLDTVENHSSEVKPADIVQYRHILGWCPQVDYHAGT